jgi:predicted DNA-binding transcriptional regulator AlpA
MSETCLTAKELADLLRISPRALDRRHLWQPEFPAPILRRPLVWRRADVEDWIKRASKRVNAA